MRSVYSTSSNFIKPDLNAKRKDTKKKATDLKQNQNSIITAA